MLSILPGRRDAHHFIALAARLTTQQQRPLGLPAEFAALANSASSTALATACRRVLTIASADAPQ
jgi:hypothetical protein